MTIRELSVEILEFNWLESSDSSLTWSCVTLSKLFKFSVLQFAYPLKKKKKKKENRSFLVDYEGQLRNACKVFGTLFKYLIDISSD